MNSQQRKCPMCESHFPGKISVYDEDGYLADVPCDRCKGTGYLLDPGEKLYVFTYRKEFTTDIIARDEMEAREKLNNAKWEMLGNPHENFLTIECLN